MKDRAFMSSSPVELLEGWRLNHTRGLSALATGAAEVSPPEVEALGLEEAVFLVGFDSNVAVVDGLQEGSVDALIVQNPYAMGYLGVESAYKLLAGLGEELEETVDTTTQIVDRGNLFSVDSQKALFAFDFRID